jgi:hypothetical protein
MKKYIVLSVNENPKYLYFLPLTVWAWRQFGWTPIVFYQGSEESFLLKKAFNFANVTIHCIDEIEGFKSETIAQVSRLYGACIADGMIMTGDIDMIPLSDYWKPEWDKITTYGHDLTDYHYPICYIAMDSAKWMQVMNIKSSDYNHLIKRDIRHQENMWVLDQDIITENLLKFDSKITEIDRGTDHRTGYPIGRVDRSHWTLNHEVFIDAHLPHSCLHNPQSYNKVMELLHKVWPNEDFTWWENYHNEFKKLL